MRKIVTVQLVWKYSPEDFIEAPIIFEFEGGRLDIRQGIAVAILDNDLFRRNHLIRDDLTKKIESMLYAVQIMMHKAFELSKPSRTDIDEDGRKSHFVEVDSGVQTQKSRAVDLVVKDEDGNIISNTKQDRIDKQSKFADLAYKHRASDFTLNKMLNSYQQSVGDPGNELIHLYEVRDALSAKFGSKSKAIAALGITSKNWDEIGVLANTLPLKQGRHRGSATETLRDAEPRELEISRKSASHLVEKYLDFLER